MEKSVSGFGGAVRPASIQKLDLDFVVRIQRDCPTVALMPRIFRCLALVRPTRQTLWAAQAGKCSRVHR